MLPSTFRSARSECWHVMHETESRENHTKALCGAVFSDAVHMTNHDATCESCRTLDNPFRITRQMRSCLRYLAVGHGDASSIGYDVPTSAVKQLRRADYITKDIENLYTPTRRGRILLQDFWTTPIPLADYYGVVHLRQDLSLATSCALDIAFPDVDLMTTAHYERLRMQPNTPLVTCIGCIALQ
jgi:hypothetical protein